MDRLYVVMPAYNEEANIRRVVCEWYSVLDGKDESSRLVVADSGSTDQTHVILVELKEEFPQLEILMDTEKEHGPKVIALYDHAIRNEADYIFQTDSDGQTDAGEFEKFWNMRRQYDVVCGCRSIRGDGRVRAFVEHVVCMLLWMYFGVHVPDANAPFRLMKTETVGKYINRMPKNYNLPNIMLTTFFTYYSEKIVFENIGFRSRRGGVNSINFPKIVKIGWNALHDFKHFKRDMNKQSDKEYVNFCGGKK